MQQSNRWFESRIYPVKRLLVYCPVALPSAQKITLVILFVTSPNCGGKLHSPWFFFSGGLSCVPLFFEPSFFSWVSRDWSHFQPPIFGCWMRTCTHTLKFSHRAKNQNPKARCPYINFWRTSRAPLVYLLLQLFLCSLSREFAVILPQKRTIETASPLSGCKQ
jgi:hypothetical protein